MMTLRVLGAFGLIVLLSAVAGALLYFVLVTLSDLFHDGVAAVREVNERSDRPTGRRVAFEAFVAASSLVTLFVVSSWTGSPVLGLAAGATVPILRATTRDMQKASRLSRRC